MLGTGVIKMHRTIPDYMFFTIQWERETIMQHTIIHVLKILFFFFCVRYEYNAMEKSEDLIIPRSRAGNLSSKPWGLRYEREEAMACSGVESCPIWLEHRVHGRNGSGRWDWKYNGARKGIGLKIGPRSLDLTLYLKEIHLSYFKHQSKILRPMF